MTRLIEVPFVFRYPAEGRIETLTLPVRDGYFPLRLVIEAMGVSWRKQYGKQGVRNFTERVLFGGLNSNPVIAVRSDYADRCLKLINPNRTAYKERVVYFQNNFAKALQDYLESIKPPPAPLPDLKPMFKAKQVSEAEYRELLGRLCPTIIGRPLERADIIRADLVRIGITDRDELDYLCRGMFIKLYKPDPKDPYGNPLEVSLYVLSYQKGLLQRHARDGYYPIPEYFRRFPDRYSRQVQYMRTIDRSGGRIKVSDGLVAVPAAQAPWYTEKFADMISDRYFIYQRALEKERDRVLKERLEAGESFLDDFDGLDFDYSIDEDEYEYTNEDGSGCKPDAGGYGGMARHTA